MHALITGGAGFIGSHLSDRMIRDGHTITILDSFDSFYSPAVKRRNVAEVSLSPRCHVIECDILDSRRLNEIDTGRIDVIVHLAARAGVRPSIEQPVLYSRVNIEGTMAILEFAREREVSRFVFGSSSSVYGNNARVPFQEHDPADFPISPYAASKRAGELLAYTYHQLYAMSVAALRFFTVYGPRQRPDLAIHKFSRRILDGEPIGIYGDGSMRRDFTYVDDIIEGIVRAVDWTAKASAYEVFNLGESATTSVGELVRLLENALGRRAAIQWLPEQPGDVRQTYADVSKASRILGYAPSTTMELGLARFAKWLEEQSPRGQ